MSETKTESKSIPEIMESLDYVLGKLEELDTIAGAVKELANISNKYARTTLAIELSNQINNRRWLAKVARDYIDNLEAAMGDKIPTIDEQDDVTEDDLPFVTAKEAHDDIPNC